MSVRIADDLWVEFGRAAERMGRSKNEIVLEAIRRTVELPATEEVLERVMVPALFTQRVDDIIVWRGKRGRVLDHQEMLRAWLYMGMREELTFEAAADHQAKMQMDDALNLLGAKSFPAIVVIDKESFENGGNVNA